MRFAYAAVIALALALLISAIMDTDASGMLRRGDFPAFYSAGTIALEGNGEELYKRDVHQEIQNKAWPSLGGAVFVYAYPPAVSLLVSPLAALDPLVAKLAFLVLMTLAAFLSFQVLGLGRYFAFSLLFAPLLAGLAAGQIVGLSMLLYALILKNVGQHFLIGVLSGLWCFKPQFGFMAFLLLFLLEARLALVLGFALGAGAIYLLSAAVCGVDWFSVWLNSAAQFSALDLEANAHQMVSLMGTMVAGLKIIGLGPHWARIIWIALAVYLFAKFYRYFKKKADIELAMIAFPAIAVLLSPHALFYDLALILPAYLLFQTPRPIEPLWKIYVFFVLVFLCAVSREYLLITPLVFVPIALLYLIYRREGNV